MKTHCYLFLFFFVTLTFSFGNAQELEDENSVLIRQYFQSNIINPVNSSTNITAKPNFNLSIIQINQVGTNQVTDVKLTGPGSQAVNQIGENNYYNFINYYSSSPSNFSIVQKGENNSLHIYGENQLVKNMSIVQNTNYSTVVIKNY